MSNTDIPNDTQMTAISNQDATAIFDFFSAFTDSDIEQINKSCQPKPKYPCADLPLDVPHFHSSGLYVAKYDTEATIKDDRLIMEKLHNPNISHIITWNETDKKFYHFRDPARLLEYLLALSPADRTYHERIYESQPQKLRLDLDYKYGIDGNRTEKFTDYDLDLVCDTIRVVLRELFNEVVFGANQDILICTSTGDKFSHHVIIDGFYTTSYLVAKRFAESVKDNITKQGYIELGKTIDLNVYKTSTGLRLSYNHKLGSDRVKLIPIGIAFEKTLITNVANCFELFIKGEITGLVHITPKIKIPHDDIQTIINAINLHNPLILTGLVLRNQVDIYINFSRAIPSECVFCGEVHHTDNTIFAIIDDGFVRIKCRHKRSECISIPIAIETPIPVVKKTTLEQMIESRLRSEARVTKVRKKRNRGIDELKFIETEIYEGKFSDVTGHSMKEYPADVSTLFVKSPMGSGKTKESVVFIQRNGIVLIIAISFRKTYTVKIIGDLNLVSYLDIKGSITADKHKKIAVQVESLHRLVAKPYELLILDEIESILAQCFSPTHKKANDSWAKFEYLIKYCDKVLCLDANLHESTVKLIMDMRGDKSSRLIINKMLPKATTHYITTIKSVAINKLLTSLEAGKRIVVPTSSRRTAECIAEMVKRKFPTKIIKLYTSLTNAAEKERDIADIERAWKLCDVLIYTPTIQAGVSFTSKHFDELISFWYNNSTDVYSSLQMIWRVRDIAGSYTHYIKERVGNRPDTPERVLAFASESCENLAKCYGVNLDYAIQADGKLEIKNDNYRTRAWLQFIADQNLSKNNFYDMFIEELTLINGTIAAEKCATKKLIKVGKDINKRLKLIHIELTKAEFQEIIDTDNISDERYDEIKDADVVTDEEKRQIKRHIVKKFYSLPADKVIDMDFLTTYWNDKTKSQYAHRKNIHGFEGIRRTVDNISHVVINSFSYGSSTEKFEKLFSVARDKHCLKFLDMFDFDFNKPTKIITNVELLAILHLNHESIVAEYNLVREAFGLNESTPPNKDDADYMLNMLRHINGKINTQYGIDIKATDHHRETYKIEDNFATLFDANFKPIK